MAAHVHEPSDPSKPWSRRTWLSALQDFSFPRRRVLTTTTPYKYRSLLENEIRLIELLPGRRKEPLRVRITHDVLLPPTKQPESQAWKTKVESALPEGWRAFRTPERRMFVVHSDGDGIPVYSHPALEKLQRRQSVDQDSWMRPAFEALSYVWGSKQPVDSVYVVGDPEQSASNGPRKDMGNQPAGLPIAANLFTALKSLRSSTVSRKMWVDALCIDQGNTEERADQVARMGLIYGLAARVVVWLGLSNAETKPVMNLLQRIGKNVEISQDNWVFPAPNATETVWSSSDPELLHIINASQFESLLRFFSRPWFSRVWTLQEVALANADAIVQCGQLEMKVYHLRRAIAGLDRVARGTNLESVVMELKLISLGPLWATVPSMLETMTARHCSDSRDKIYGALNLFPPTFARSIQPSYEMSVEAVHRDAFLKYSTQTQRLDLLEFCSAFATARLEGPSWVPNLSSRSASDPGFPSGLNAAGLSASILQPTSGDVLEVMGVHCGTVSAVCQPRKDSTVLERMREFEAKVSNASECTAKEIRVDTWAHLLSCGYTAERFPYQQYPSIEAHRARLIEILDSSPRSNSGSQDSMSFSIDNTNRKTTLFSLSSGKFGLGMGQIKRGDCICVLLGCYLPLILRPKSKSQFAVLGPCFVPGLMDSEALLGPLPTPWAAQSMPDTRYRPTYLNKSTGEQHIDDPRLEPLPDDWERFDDEWTRDLPVCMDFFRQKSTGEVQYSDPRLSVGALRARGVTLELVELV